MSATKSASTGMPYLNPKLTTVTLSRVVSGVTKGYLAEGKRFMSIAIGCTGGKHRSVAMTEEVARQMRELGYDVGTVHRDLGRE